MGLRLHRGRFEGKGAVVWRSLFPVADSPETTPPGPGLQQTWVAAKGLHWDTEKHRFIGLKKHKKQSVSICV